MTTESDLAVAAAAPDPAVGLRAVRALRVLTEELERRQVRRARDRGWSWAEIGEALATLPADHPPTKRDWARLSAAWHDALTEQIEAMTKVRDGLTDCIGCGCLSVTSCPIYNAGDAHAADGAGAQRWPSAARA